MVRVPPPPPPPSLRHLVTWVLATAIYIALRAAFPELFGYR